MTTYNERAGTSLLTGAVDPQGDPITVRRINGTIISSWPHTVSFTGGSAIVSQDGTVVYDDGGSGSDNPFDGVARTEGTFTFTLWDGSAESATYTATVSLTGRAPPATNGTPSNLSLTAGTPMTPVDLTALFSGFGVVPSVSPSSPASLPPGLSITGGVLSGTPTTSAGAVTIVIRGTNVAGFVDQAGFTITVAAASSSMSVAFGALTAAGAGGVPVSGASITSGNTGTHWQIVGGVLSPTSAGDSANLSSGPYTLTLNDSSTVNITIEANTYHVRTNAEFAAVAALSDATLSGKVCKLRAGTYQFASMSNMASSNRYYGNATSSTWTDGTIMFEIAAADPSNKPLVEYFPGAQIRAPTNLRWRNLRMKMIYRPGQDIADSSSKGLWVASGSVRNFQAIGVQFESNFRQIGIVNAIFGMLGLSNSGNGTQAGGFLLEDCTFDGGSQCLSINAGSANAHTQVIRRCTFSGYEADCISMGLAQGSGTADCTKTLLEDVLMTNPWNRDADVRFNSGAVLSRSAALTGAGNSQKLTFFAMVNVYSGDTFTGNVFSQATDDFRVRLVTAGAGLVNVVVEARDTTGANVVSMTSSSTFSTRRGEWLGILVSLDTTGTHRLYVWSNRYNSVGWTSQAAQAGGGQTLRLGGTPTTVGAPSMQTRWLSYWQGVALDATSTTVQNYFVNAADPTYLPIYTTAGSPYTITIPAGLVSAAGTPLVEFGRTYDGWVNGTNTGSGGNFSRTGVIERNHGDAFQFTAGVNNVRLTDITIRRLVLFEHAEGIPYVPDRQVLFLDDTNGGDMDRIVVFGLAAYVATNYSQFLNSPQNCITRGVTIVPNLAYWRRVNSIPASTTPGFRVVRGTAATGSWAIEDAFTPLQDTVDPGFSANPITRTNAISPYATPPNLTTWEAYCAANFVGGGANGFAPKTVAEFLAAYAVKSGGALDQAIDVGGINSYFTYDFTTGGSAAHPRGNL